MNENENAEESNEEKMIMYYKLKQDYFEERKKIISQLNKKTKFIEMANEKKRIELKRKILESEIVKRIVTKMQKIKSRALFIFSLSKIT